jgi:hypothetical protein
MTPRTKYLAAIVAAVSAGCAGCAGIEQAVQTYGGIAVSNARAANDTLIDGYKVGICALPLSAIARHPEIVPAVRSLCLSPGDKVTEEILTAIEKQAAWVKP